MKTTDPIPDQTSAVIRRIIIVRRDATTVYEQLLSAYGNDTVILYDRRAAVRAHNGNGFRHGQPERRRFQEADILNRRGFYSLRRVGRELESAGMPNTPA